MFQAWKKVSGKRKSFRKTRRKFSSFSKIICGAESTNSWHWCHLLWFRLDGTFGVPLLSCPSKWMLRRRDNIVREDIHHSAADDPSFTMRIIIWDKIWANEYEAAIKQQRSQWTGPSSLQPKNVLLSRGSMKSRFIFVFDIYNIVHEGFIPGVQAVNWVLYSRNIWGRKFDECDRIFGWQRIRQHLRGHQSRVLFSKHLREQIWRKQPDLKTAKNPHSPCHSLLQTHYSAYSPSADFHLLSI